MTSFALRVIALCCMFADHLGRTILSECIWLTYIGRLAFPIFAFQLVEGYLHTRNKYKYALRLFLFALISEFPFDLMAYGTPIYWGHQNIMWTLLLGFICIHLADSLVKHLQPSFLRSLSNFVLVFFFFTAATVLRLDYLGFGILQIYLFYRFYDRKHFPLLVIGTLLINYVGAGVPYIHLAGLSFPSQILATLALVPIYFYNGTLGYRSAAWSFFCYMFYPCHLALLFLLSAVF